MGPAGFDLPAYLARIGYSGPCEPTLSVLQAVHALHPAAIPFEAIDPLLRREVSLDLDALQAKLVGQRRGGYCFEQNTLLEAALSALGFRVTRMLGRVRWMRPAGAPPGPRTHLLLRVAIDGVDFLADVGFGSLVLGGPLRLDVAGPQEVPVARVRLVSGGQGVTLQADLDGVWHDAYRFTYDPVELSDCVCGNWFTSTHPQALFTGNLVVERLTASCRYRLFNTKLTARHHDGRLETRILEDAATLGTVLETVFGVSPPVDPGEIWRRLPVS